MKRSKLQSDVEGKELFDPIDFLFSRRFSPHKLSYFLAYLLKAAREGHLCVALENHSLFPSLDPNLDLQIIEEIHSLPPDLFGGAVVQRENRYYLQRNWECEERFIIHWKRLISHEPSLSIDTQWLKAELDKKPLHLEQKEAILKAASQTVTLICGGPGTGKTLTAATLIELFMEAVKAEVVVAAPTGKATANIRHSLGKIAEKIVVKTLHSVLRQQKIRADLLLIDEGSMVDAELMSSVFAAVKEGARLIILGDKDQLPPVEAGNFFADLAERGAKLTHCFRAELKEIVDLAETVKQRKPIAAEPLPDVKNLVRKIADENKRVLTPLRKGPYGVDNLNRLLYQEHQKRGKKEIPIMITVNDPNQDLFNGDTGVLIEGIAYFQERQIPEYLLPHYEYAYVLSVHKSQGSEYDSVTILLPQGSEIFGWQMLYTAITRAKKEVEVLAHENVIEILVKSDRFRCSGISMIR